MLVTPFVVQPTGIGWPDYITAISDPSSIAQAVYFDSVAGVAGTNYPTGTASAPVNNLPDLRTICTNRSIHKIVNIDISVLATLDAAMLNYEFVNWYLDLNGQDVTDSQFKQCSLIGIAGGTNLLATDSILSNITNAGQPYLSGCVISNNFVLPTGVGVSASLINCEYLNCIMFVNDNTVDVIGGAGTLTVRDVDNAASVLNIYGFGGYIILANTCTLGIINLYGDFVLTRASLAGSVVNDYRISKEYGQEAIYYNSVGGEAGTAYPIGRADRPVNNFNDLVAICIARKITTIVLMSDITLLDHMLGYYIKSQTSIYQSSVFTNGKLLFNMTFENVRLEGAITAGSWVYCLRCTVLSKVGIGGWYEDCELVGTHQIGVTLALRLNNCSATGAGCTLNFASGGGGMGVYAYLKDCHGLFTISNCNDAMDRLEFMSTDARLIINNTCTLGNILLYGAFVLVNNSAGSTITDYRLSKRIVSSMDFWSLPQEEVAVTSGAGNKALPDVVVAGIPTGNVVIRAVALFRFRVVENTFAGANSLSGAQAIQLQDDSPSGYINAINFVASMFTFTAVGREGGLIIEGAIDVKVPVDGIDTYNFQWTAAVAAQNNLQFNDVQVGLRVYFSPS
jgi:hypothetical protein